MRALLRKQPFFLFDVDDVEGKKNSEKGSFFVFEAHYEGLRAFFLLTAASFEAYEKGIDKMKKTKNGNECVTFDPGSCQTLVPSSMCCMLFSSFIKERIRFSLVSALACALRLSHAAEQQRATKTTAAAAAAVVVFRYVCCCCAFFSFSFSLRPCFSKKTKIQWTWTGLIASRCIGECNQKDWWPFSGQIEND